MKLTLIAEMPGGIGSQRAIHAWHLKDARDALDAAVAQLAHRTGQPTIDRASLGTRDDPPTPARIVDIAQLAILAEVLVAQGEELDALRVRLAAIENERS